MGARDSRQKFGTKAGKYKLWVRTEGRGQNQGRGLSKKPAGKYKEPAQSGNAKITLIIYHFMLPVVSFCSHWLVLSSSFLYKRKTKRTYYANQRKQIFLKFWKKNQRAFILVSSVARLQTSSEIVKLWKIFENPS